MHTQPNLHFLNFRLAYVKMTIYSGKFLNLQKIK